MSGSLVVGIGSPTETDTLAEVRVYAAGLLATVASLWLVSQVAALPLWLWKGRTLRRRSARGECLACGYDLKVPASTSS